MLPAFDEPALKRELTALTWTQALAFGAASAERIAPSYGRFCGETGWGDPASLRRALDLVWEVADMATVTNEAMIRQLLSAFEAAAHDSEGFDSLLASGAQDAVFVVCSLLDFLLDKSLEHITLAAQYITDSIDLYVQELENMGAQELKRESLINSHPLMQQELLRQNRDLNRLRTGEADTIGDIRRIASQEYAFELSRS